MKLLLALLFFTPHSFSQERTTAPDNFIKTEEESDRLSLTKYNSIYYLHGDPTTKLQFSFKYQLVQALPIYFGYTQLMFWNLRQESKPFKDINYGPDVFYHYDVPVKILKSIDISPYAHLSNGRDGSASRSINRWFARFNFEMPLSEGVLRFTPTIFGFYGLSNDNSDIYKYLSPIDLKVTLTQFIPWIFDKGEFYLRIFPGGSYAERWGGGGQELGLNFRLGGIGLKPSIYFQYYNGYAESLLEYKKYENQFRVGILL